MGTDAAADVEALLARVRTGDRAALNELLAGQRDAVRAFLDLRLDRRLRARVDVSDVLQEAQVEMARRMDDFLARSPMPFHIWVLKTAHEQLLRLRRRHLGAACRDAGREVGLPDQASVVLAGRLAAAGGTPSRQVAAAELADRVRAALADLAEADREVILLRTFEGLSNQDTAALLGLEPDATSKRYARALIRLKQALA